MARWRRERVALIGFPAPALKCRARDAWIGWDFRVRYDRLYLVTDNSRFLIPPGRHRPNLASRLLWPCERRLVADWPRRALPVRRQGQSAQPAGRPPRPLPTEGQARLLPQHRQCRALARAESRAPDRRGHPSHPRLLPGRGPLPHPIPRARSVLAVGLNFFTSQRDSVSEPQITCLVGPRRRRAGIWREKQ